MAFFQHFDAGMHQSSSSSSSSSELIRPSIAMTEDMINLASILNSSINTLLGELLLSCVMILRLVFALFRFVTQKESTELHDDMDREEERGDGTDNDDESPPPLEGRTVYDDARVVLERLGMVEMLMTRGSASHVVEEDGDHHHGLLMEGVSELLEEKEASLEELKEAFYVFDRNEDGFVTAGELWCVMRRLGLDEGLRLEDCERMIRAFDEDGDGRISFSEFKTLMEIAT